jgi:hypothetical protein
VRSGGRDGLNSFVMGVTGRKVSIWTFCKTSRPFGTMRNTENLVKTQKEKTQ